MSYIHFIPSFYGDIRLTPEGKTALIEWWKLAPGEKTALRALAKTAQDKTWLGGYAIKPDEENGKVSLDAPLAKVKKILVKALKPGREIVSAVSFTNGKIEETTSALLAKIEEPAPKPKAGVDVAKPKQGCPEPDFAKAELRAREVLTTFLDEEQLADFERYNRFVTIGALTGHRYMVTSRHARDSLAHYRRQVYDLDEKRPFCIHDYDVPAAEEMLAIHILLSLPQHENYVRHLE